MRIIPGPFYGILRISILKFTLIGALIVAFILILLLFLPSKIGNGDSSGEARRGRYSLSEAGTSQRIGAQPAESGPEQQ
jgi:hypothetical protein